MGQRKRGEKGHVRFVIKFIEISHEFQMKFQWICIGQKKSFIFIETFLFGKYLQKNKSILI